MHPSQFLESPSNIAETASLPPAPRNLTRVVVLLLLASKDLFALLTVL